MSTDHEVERLKKVYQSYRASGIAQTLWSETNPGNRAILQERTRVLQQTLKAAGFFPLTNHRILDIGCGCGRVLADFVQWGASPQNLYGIDLLAERIKVAQQGFPELHFQQGNAERIDYQDASFDLVILFTVLSSILDDRMAYNVAGETQRVLKPGGFVLWYDFRYNNPQNPHTRGMTRQRIRQFFPDFELRLGMITLLPPLARRLGSLTSVLYPLLALVPLLRTHYLGLLVKPKEN